VNADVAKTSVIHGEPNGHAQECVSYAERSRGDGAQCDRGRLVKGGGRARVHTTPKTVAKWIERFEAEGVVGLRDRSSRPLSSPSLTLAAVCAPVEALRRQRHTGKQMAAEVGVSAATISRILRRLGLNRLSALEPAEPVRRDERAAPGEIITSTSKARQVQSDRGHRITGDRTGQSNTRGVGWEYVHLAIDDHSRLAYSEILRDENRASCLRFLFNVLRFFRSLSVRVERVMTDNSTSFRSRRYAKAPRLLKIKHLRTKPYMPKTTDVIDKCFLAGSQLFSSRAWVTARRRAGREAQVLPRSLHRRPSVAAPVRTRLGPRGFQPETKRA
jgi:transposase